jgi:hypothetical protein
MKESCDFWTHWRNTTGRSSIFLSHTISITELVNANKNGTRNLPPCPLKREERFVQALKDIKIDDVEASIVPQLETNVALPSQVVFGTAEPRSNVNTDREIKNHTEEPPSNGNMIAREMERNVEASDSDAVFPKNALCFDAYEIDSENVTKVFEASMSRNDLGKQELCVFAAIHYGYIRDLEHELSEDNVDLHRRDSRNRTCVDFAAVMGRLDMVQLILDRGGTFGVFARSVMMPLARERDAARKNNEEGIIPICQTELSTT